MAGMTANINYNFLSYFRRKKMELGPNQKRWIAALRSGEYKQGRFTLCHDDEYCCLGVACDVFGIPYETESGVRFYSGNEIVLTVAVRDMLGLKDVGGKVNDEDMSEALFYHNDNGYTFEQIADTMERFPEKYFKESV
jgi:hypothetical protein